MTVKNYLINKNAGGCFYLVSNFCWGECILFFFLLGWVGGGGCVFVLQAFWLIVQLIAEDHIYITQRCNKKKKTLHFSDHICSLSDKTLQSSLSATASCHECQWRPGMQQYVCSNPKKCTIWGWHLVLSGSCFKYSLSLTSMPGLCRIMIDIKHLRDDPDQRHPDFSL